MFRFSTRQLFVAQQKAVRYIYLLWTATARGGTSRSHTSNIVPAWLAERAWCPVLTSEYFFVSAGSSPRTNLVTKVVTLLLKVGHKTYPIYDSRLSKSFLCVNRNPIRYDFRGGAKAVRYSVKITLPKYVLRRHVANFKCSKEGSR